MGRKRRRENGHGLDPALEEALVSLERTGRPVFVRKEDAIAGVLISLEDFREHVAGPTPELEVVKPERRLERKPERKQSMAGSPTDTLAALRELHELSDQ
jgi:hypothetical protein